MLAISCVLLFVLSKLKNMNDTATVVHAKGLHVFLYFVLHADRF